MITAMLVRFKSPVAFIQMPRKVNETTNLQAAMPVLEINRLTNLLGFGVQTINVIALVIILVSGILKEFLLLKPRVTSNKDPGISS